MARLSLVDMGFFSDCDRYSCSSSTDKLYASRLSSWSSKLISTSSTLSPLAAGVQPFAECPWPRGVAFGVRGKIEMLSSEDDWPRGVCLDMASLLSSSWSSAGLRVFVLFRRLRGGVLLLLGGLVDMGAAPLQTSDLDSRASRRAGSAEVPHISLRNHQNTAAFGNVSSAQWLLSRRPSALMALLHVPEATRYDNRRVYLLCTES